MVMSLWAWFLTILESALELEPAATRCKGKEEVSRKDRSHVREQNLGLAEWAEAVHLESQVSEWQGVVAGCLEAGWLEACWAGDRLVLD